MKKEFKVQAISEKVEVLEVNGQDSYTCLHNCHRNMWVGNSSLKTKSCKFTDYSNAYESVKN